MAISSKLTFKVSGEHLPSGSGRKLFFSRVIL